MSQGNSQFSLNLYKNLCSRENEPNVFFSPFSIFGALSMTSAGAHDNTLKQMLQVLNMPDCEDNHAAFGKILTNINSERDAATLKSANRLFVQKDFQLKEAFKQLTGKHYQAGAETHDFKKDAEGSRKLINKWVEDQTEDKIKNLLKENTVEKDTRLILVNAIYFKGDWTFPFDAANTKRMPFHGSRKTVDVDMMFMEKEDMLYGEVQELGVKYLQLNYGPDKKLGSSVSLGMYFVLPDSKSSLDKMVAAMNGDMLSNMLMRLNKCDAKIYLPKFKMEDEFDLKDQLVAMGMKDAFDRDNADFTAMAHFDRSKENLVISKVVHKAFLEVNEEGAEAAAATAVQMMMFSCLMPNPKIEFKFDRPFLFFIAEKRSRNILFMGHYGQP